MRTEYTREQLIGICEKSIVDVSKWRNRDSPESQEKTGVLWALLKANCQFEVLYDDGLCTNENTIWVKVWSPKFMHFEYGFSLKDKDTMEDSTYYLPTPSRLEASQNGDWY